MGVLVKMRPEIGILGSTKDQKSSVQSRETELISNSELILNEKKEEFEIQTPNPLVQWRSIRPEW